MTRKQRNAVAVATSILCLAGGGGVAYACTGDPGWTGTTSTGTTGTTTTTSSTGTTTAATTAAVRRATRRHIVRHRRQSARG